MYMIHDMAHLLLLGVDSWIVIVQGPLELPGFLDYWQRCKVILSWFIGFSFQSCESILSTMSTFNKTASWATMTSCCILYRESPRSTVHSLYELYYRCGSKPVRKGIFMVPLHHSSDLEFGGVRIWLQLVYWLDRLLHCLSILF